MTVGALKSSSILVKPSPLLRDHIKHLPRNPEMPPGILDVCTNDDSRERLLTVHELRWLQEQAPDVHLHELLDASEIVLPTNPKVARNPVLEERCKKLQDKWDDRRYRAMTKDVGPRDVHREDSLAFQLGQINTHLIAVAQVVVSVLAGFAFGFIGMETFVGRMDLGVRLLSGILSAVIIALAELYFVLRKLSADC